MLLAMRPTLLAALVLLPTLACVSTDRTSGTEPDSARAPAASAATDPTSVAGEPAAPLDAPAAQEPEPGWNASIRRELEGADFERQYTDTLELVPPRELSGAEADGRARRAFLALNESEQRDLLDWFTVESAKLGTFQGTLIRYVVDAYTPPEGGWPALAPAPIYDPQVHAPGQPIPRRPLAAAAPDAIAVRNQLLSAPGVRRLDSGWMVDYAAHGLVRLPHQDDPVRVFENALLGMAPDWDLAEALVELTLDSGALQKEFAAFAHAYTDRWGGVYPGVTLYDAYAADLTVEMPDVDTLGIVHDLFGDWEVYTAPVPPDQQADLYARTGDVSRRLIRHRGLRTNLARTYLCGSAELRDSYAGNLDAFHALWDGLNADPARLAAELPDDAGWRGYLQGLLERTQNEPDFWLRGTQRHAQLERDAQAVRATMLRLLNEYEAYKKIEELPPFGR